MRNGRDRACVVKCRDSEVSDETHLLIKGSMREDGKRWIDYRNLPRLIKTIYRNLQPYTRVFIEVDPKCNIGGINLISIILDARNNFIEDGSRPHITFGRRNEKLVTAYEMALKTFPDIRKEFPLVKLEGETASNKEVNPSLGTVLPYYLL